MDRDEIRGRMAALEHWLAQVMAELKHPDALLAEKARLETEDKRNKGGWAGRGDKTRDDYRRAQSLWLLDEALKRKSAAGPKGRDDLG